MARHGKQPEAQEQARPQVSPFEADVKTWAIVKNGANSRLVCFTLRGDQVIAVETAHDNDIRILAEYGQRALLDNLIEVE